MMKQKSGTDQGVAQNLGVAQSQGADNKLANKVASSQTSDNFVAGLVTFILFLIFMTGWMYFSI